MANDTSLRAGTAADADFLFHLLVEALGPYVEQTYGRWNAAEQRARFDAAPQTEAHQIVECGGVPIGCLKVQRSPDEIKLHRVFLLPAFQNQGIGTRLVRELIAEARAAELPLRLRVFRVNPAQHLYERLGFRATGETDTHIMMELGS